MNSNLTLFIEFLTSIKKTPGDLQFLPSPDEWLDSLLGKNAKKFFRIHFRNAAGDLVGEWDINGGFDENESFPFVWLSSEGTNTVVASNSNEFLSILPYGQGIITGIPDLLKTYRKRPTKVIAPEIEFDKINIKNAYLYQASNFNGHPDMVNFITNTLGIAVNESPLETISKAVDNFPDVDKWIEETL